MTNQRACAKQRDFRIKGRILSGAQEDVAVLYAEGVDGMYCRREQKRWLLTAGTSARRPDYCAWQMGSMDYDEKEWTDLFSRVIGVW